MDDNCLTNSTILVTKLRYVINISLDTIPVFVYDFELPDPKRTLVPHMNSKKLVICVTARVCISPADIQNV